MCGFHIKNHSCACCDALLYHYHCIYALQSQTCSCKFTGSSDVDEKLMLPAALCSIEKSKMATVGTTKVQWSLNCLLLKWCCICCCCRCRGRNWCGCCHFTTPEHVVKSLAAVNACPTNSSLFIRLQFLVAFCPRVSHFHKVFHSSQVC